MNRKIAVLALLSCAACYSGDPDLGACSADTDCVNLPDGGQLAGAFCNSNKRCEYACAHICALAEACVNAACELQGPRITTVSAPTIWSLPSASVTVTGVVDDTGGPGIASAILRISGKPDVTGTTTDTGIVRTYSFTVPGSVQASNSETPVAFSIVATDTAGGVTPDRAAGTGQVLIDGLGPSLVGGVTVNGGVTGGAQPQIKWFAQNQPGLIDVMATIQDNGSGVNTSSLSLVLTGTTTVLSTGAPQCTAQTAQTQLCHFSVMPSTTAVPPNSQRRVSFAIAGTDVAGNPIQTNVAALGIDGKPPSVTFTIGAANSGSTTTYPPPFADCNGSDATGNHPDGTMYCGHDGQHFWRAGDGKYSITFTVTDVGSGADAEGSGVAQAGGTCSIDGTTGCTATFSAAGSTATTSQFVFPANFANATFTSAADGTGPINITVNGADLVGNTPSVGATTPANVTRLKWMRSMATKIDTFKASPIATSTPVSQAIFAGIEKDALGAIVSVARDGSVLWRAAQGANISNNIAYSSRTQRLYLAADGAANLVVFAITTDGLGASFSCPLTDGVTPGTAVGSPAIFSGTTERALIADNQGRLWSLTGTPGVGCATVGNSFTNGNAWTALGSISTDGTSVYVPHDVSKLAKVDFDGTFKTATEAVPFNVLILAPVSIGGSLFFGNRGAPAQLFSYSRALSPTWGPSGGTLADGLNAPVVVNAAYAFASPLSGDGQLHAFKRADGAEAWHWPTTTAKIGTITAPAFGSDGVIYFGADAVGQLVPLIVAGDVPALANNWTTAYVGSAGQATAGVVGPPAIPSTTTVVDSLPTEPVVDAAGLVYFATRTGGKLFALITDSPGPFMQGAGGAWPRVGFDNCNSGNAAFSCQ